jgi:hypothetical protein
MPWVFGHRADGHQRVRPLDGVPSVRWTTTPVGAALDAVGAAAADVHAAPLEDGLQQLGRVDVLARAAPARGC